MRRSVDFREGDLTPVLPLRTCRLPACQGLRFSPQQRERRHRDEVSGDCVGQGRGKTRQVPLGSAAGTVGGPRLPTAHRVRALAPRAFQVSESGLPGGAGLLLPLQRNGLDVRNAKRTQPRVAELGPKPRLGTCMTFVLYGPQPYGAPHGAPHGQRAQDRPVPVSPWLWASSPRGLIPATQHRHIHPCHSSPTHAGEASVALHHPPLHAETPQRTLSTNDD